MLAKRLTPVFPETRSLSGKPMMTLLIGLLMLSVSAYSEPVVPPLIPPAKSESETASRLSVPLVAESPMLLSEGIEIQMVWQSYYADLDLYLTHSELGEECYYGNSFTSWGCIYNYDNFGGRKSSDSFPYTEQITVDLDHLLQNPPCTYTFWVNYYGGHSTPRFIAAHHTNCHRGGEGVGK